MFKITGGKGFHITFDNGNTISIQFGPGNYCDNYSINFTDFLQSKEDISCNNAEIAVWNKDGIWITKDFFPDANDDVIGHLTPNEILELMVKVAQ